MDETLTAAIITEQGGKENHRERKQVSNLSRSRFGGFRSTSQAATAGLFCGGEARILEETDRALASGAGVGAILRREGIYSSSLHNWRKERDQAVRKAFSQKRGPQPQRNSLAAENEKLRRQNQHLQEEELEKAHIIIDVQKKVARLLGHPITETEKS